MVTKIVHTLEEAQAYFLSNSSGNLICFKGDKRKEVDNYQDAVEFYSK